MNWTDFQRIAESGADKMLSLKEETEGWKVVEHGKREEFYNDFWLM